MTLVIVDMQDNFATSGCERTINGCKREINRSIKKKEPIILLEHTVRNYGRTLYDLRTMVHKYDKAFFVEKLLDDGSKEVIETCKEKELPFKFRICGVNARYCVRETVCGLGVQYPVSVVCDAINCIPLGNGDDAEHRKLIYKVMEKYEVKLIRKKNLFK